MVKPVRDRLAEFLEDGLRFVLVQGSVIERCPLQTYCRALVFSPVKSVIRKQFWEERHPAIESISGHGRTLGLLFTDIVHTEGRRFHDIFAGRGKR